MGLCEPEKEQLKVLTYARLEVPFSLSRCATLGLVGDSWMSGCGGRSARPLMKAGGGWCRCAEISGISVYQVYRHCMYLTSSV